MLWKQICILHTVHRIRIYIAEIQRGVDTDWMVLPLRNAFDHKHSLFIEGGTQNLRWGVDASYTVSNEAFYTIQQPAAVFFAVSRFQHDRLKVGACIRFRLAYCLQNGLPLDMDVYDLAEWCCMAELTRLSIENNSAPVEIPDFTRGIIACIGAFVIVGELGVNAQWSFCFFVRQRDRHKRDIIICLEARS